MTNKLTALLALLALSPLPAASGAVAGESVKVPTLPIVEKSIAFHGGEIFSHSLSSLEVCSRSGCFTVRAKLDGGLFEYVVESQSGESRRKVLWNNDETREWRDGQPVELDEPAAQKARDFVSARTYFPHLPFRLADAAAWKEDLGLETWGQRRLHKVKVTFTPGSSTDSDDEYLYWFDPETGRLVQFAYSFKGSNGTGLRFREMFDERRVGGVLFADQTNLGAEAPGLSVDDITPSFVQEKMEEVSTVTFKNIEVEPLAHIRPTLPAAKP